MTTMLRLAGLALSLLALALPAHAEPLNCTSISSLPFSISAPGNYCLDQSFVHAGNAISIVADDVVLDFNGHTLEGVAGMGGSAVQATDRRNVTVRNGAVRNFVQGIDLAGGAAEGYVVERMRLYGNGFSGINVQGKGAVVRGNLLIGNGNSGSPGPRWSVMVASPGAHVVDNEIIDTALGASSEAVGIKMSFSPRSTVERNVVSNSGASSSFAMGIRFSNQSDGSTAIGNRVFGFPFGIVFESGPGLYRDNTVNGATTPFFGGTAGGNPNNSF